jgi:hypothetical protein
MAFVRMKKNVVGIYASMLLTHVVFMRLVMDLIVIINVGLVPAKPKHFILVVVHTIILFVSQTENIVVSPNILNLIILHVLVLVAKKVYAPWKKFAVQVDVKVIMVYTAMTAADNQFKIINI